MHTKLHKIDQQDLAVALDNMVLFFSDISYVCYGFWQH